MDNFLKDVLQVLGLSQKEILFVITAYQLGPTTIREIAKTAKLQRSTAYLLAQDLLEKKIISEGFEHYRKTIHVIEPKQLLRMLSAKQRHIRRKELEFEELLPQLHSQFVATEIRPRVRVFEGIKGLLLIWNEILSTKSEVLLWTNQETEKHFFSQQQHDAFITQRVKKHIFMRVLAVNNKAGKVLQKADIKFLRLTKLLPAQTVFSSETYIFDDKIAVLDYHNEIMGIITQSTQIAESQKAIFETMWRILPARGS